jgi:hypothetical protein
MVAIRAGSPEGAVEDALEMGQDAWLSVPHGPKGLEIYRGELDPILALPFEAATAGSGPIGDRRPHPAQLRSISAFCLVFVNGHLSAEDSHD